MSFRQRIITKVWAALLLISLYTSTAFATSPITEINSVSERQKKMISDYIIKELSNEYEQLYRLDNFEITFSDSWSDSENQLWIDADILMDMTLVASPENHPFLKGIKKFYNEHTSAFGLNYYINNYKLISQNYNKAEKTEYALRIMLSESNDSIILYDRMDFSDDYIAILPFGKENICDFNAQVEAGYKACEEFVKDTNSNSNSLIAPLSDSGNTGGTFYYASRAVSYAKLHGADTPEYSSANGTGSDCANFLSYCLNAGGIPQTESWAPTKANWIRTGANNNGGVTPYMVNCGYFKKQTSLANPKAGSFLFWNTDPRSHVALITQVTGSEIRITDHSSSKRSKSSVNRLLSNSWRSTAKLYNYNGMSD